ncbi:MAG: hypothetical protein ABIB93_04325 [Chloroflexota bacterium]
MVETPVGARCRECARLYKLPTFNVTGRHYLIAVLVGMGMGLVTGIIWGLAVRFIYFPFINFLLALATGSAVGEVISLSVNRKRGIGLAVISGMAVVLSYLVAHLAPWGLPFGLFDLLSLAIGIAMAVNRLR